MRCLIPVAAATSACNASFASATTPSSVGEVAADLRDVGVDVNQPRRRDVEGEARIPRARVGFGEARADREDDVGGAALSLAIGVPQKPVMTEEQRVILADARPCPSGCARWAAPAALASAASSADARAERTPPPA